MSVKSLEWYINNGCELQAPGMNTLKPIYSRTHGNPCNGCGCKHFCKAWQLINHPSSKSQPGHSSAKVETNAEIAARLGVTKRQVGRMRKEGRL